MLSHREAKRVANAHLQAQGSDLVAVRAHRRRGVWVVEAVDPADPAERLTGEGGLAVTDNGDVHELSSVPGSLDRLVMDLGIWSPHPDTDYESLELLADTDPDEAESLRALKEARQRERGE